ncbi:MAG: hypothetical protein MRJ92_02435 [Nitrospira sp.]|nr:hypothetical protein [Nitrospira sp.]
MGPAGRCAGSIVALCGFILAVACGDASITGLLRSQRQGNQDTLELLTRLLDHKRNQTGLYLHPCPLLVFPRLLCAGTAGRVGLSAATNKPEAYLIRAKAEDARRISQALDDYSAAIRLESDCGRSLWPRIDVHAGVSRKDREALEDFTAAIRLDVHMSGPTHSVLRCTVGMSSIVSPRGFGRCSHARSWYTECLLQRRIRPLRIGARRRRAKFLTSAIRGS